MRKYSRFKSACALGLAAFLALGSVSVSAQEVAPGAVESQSLQDSQPATQPPAEQETTAPTTAEAVELTAQTSTEQETNIQDTTASVEETTPQNETETSSIALSEQETSSEQQSSSENSEIENFTEEESTEEESSSEEDYGIDLLSLEGDYNFSNVVIFAYFSDAPEGKAYFEDTSNTAAIMSYYTGSSVYSFYNYMSAISQGQLSVNCIFPQYDGSKITPYCITGVSTSQASIENVDVEVIGEILKNTDMSNYKNLVDYNNDGVVDNFTVVLYGGDNELSKDAKSTPTLYAHKADYGSTENKLAGKIVGPYNMLNMTSISSSEAGVISHEFMHTLGFPDLYPIDSTQYPVGQWDIMASSLPKQSYPLAYMRKNQGWLSDAEVPTITSSANGLTLDLQSAVGGKKAYILKSPLNDQEFFVIEFRKKSQRSYGVLDVPETYDYYISGSGLIVYRINTKVEDLSNHHGETGVYVFRPQAGQTGYYAESTNQNIGEAFLSSEAGRTTMGFSDMNKVLTDGAIAFSDGSNSGIVISNVSSASGNQMTFDVTIPSAEQFDTWKNTDFSDTADTNAFGKSTAVISYNNTLYMAAYKNNGNLAISLLKYQDGAWVTAASDISASTLSDMQLFVHNNQLCMAYEKWDSQIHIMQLSGSTWTQLAAFSGDAPFCAESIDGKIYVNHALSDGWNAKALLTVIDNGKATTLPQYYYGSFGDTKIANIGSKVYVSLRHSDNTIEIYCYEGSTCTRLDKTFSANTYDMAAYNNKLYVTLGNTTTMKLNIYDGSNWTEVDSGYECFQPKLTVSQGSLYILMIPDTNGYIQVYRYDSSASAFVKEGINIDGYPSTLDFASIGNVLYVAYVRGSDNKIIVKKKETVIGWSGANFYGQSLSLDGDIGINFYMELSEDVSSDGNSYMEFRYPSGKNSVVKLSAARSVNDKYYVFSARVASNQVDDEVTAVMHRSNGEELASKSYSVANYIDKAQDTTDEKLKNLTTALSVYGQYSKAYFSSSPILKETDDMNNVTLTTLEAYKSVRTGSLPDGITYDGSALELESVLAIHHYFKLNSGKISDYTFKVDGVTVQPVKVGDSYCIIIPDIVSKKIDNTYELKINDSYSIKYSAFSYAYNVLKAQNNLQTLVKALYLYNAAAKAYFV